MLPYLPNAEPRPVVSEEDVAAPALVRVLHPIRVVPVDLLKVQHLSHRPVRIWVEGLAKAPCRITRDGGTQQAIAVGRVVVEAGPLRLTWPRPRVFLSMKGDYTGRRAANSPRRRYPEERPA